MAPNIHLELRYLIQKELFFILLYCIYQDTDVYLPKCLISAFEAFFHYFRGCKWPICTFTNCMWFVWMFLQDRLSPITPEQTLLSHSIIRFLACLWDRHCFSASSHVKVFFTSINNLVWNLKLRCKLG